MKDDYRMKAGDEFDQAVAWRINEAWALIQDTRWMFPTEKDFHRGVYDSTALSVSIEGMYRKGVTHED